MSASLVGSEMCIRDSAQRMPGRTPFVACPARRPGPRARARARARGGERRCGWRSVGAHPGQERAEQAASLRLNMDE
eukprot:934956-Alexandrium_andersonii.AAC.1